MLSKEIRQRFKPKATQSIGSVEIDVKSVEVAVLKKLGVPKDFSRTTVRRITHNTFRVNIYIAAMLSYRLTDSFFITYQDGEFRSNPPISRKYTGG